MIRVSSIRLWLLRGVYALIALGAGSLSWWRLVDGRAEFELEDGFVVSMLAACSALCLVGLRHPLRFLPILFWEIIWKVVWLARIALPAWREGRVDEAIATNIVACGMVVIVVVAVPWRYVWATYFAGNRGHESSAELSRS